jgi:hypothetical protein
MQSQPNSRAPNILRDVHSFVGGPSRLCAYKEVEAGALAAEQRVEVVVDGDTRKLLGGDVGGTERGDCARAEGRVGEVEEVGEGEAERGVPDKLEPLVGSRRVGEGLVRERLVEESAVTELVGQQAFHTCRGFRAVGDEARPRDMDGRGGARRGWRRRWSRRPALAGLVRRRHGSSPVVACGSAWAWEILRDASRVLVLPTPICASRLSPMTALAASGRLRFFRDS